MLVLSRHRDECIMVGDNIVVTIVDIRGDKVRIGIQAPSEIPVHRAEVWEAIQRENRKTLPHGVDVSKLTPHDKFRYDKAVACNRDDKESLYDAVAALQSTDHPSLVPLCIELTKLYFEKFGAKKK